MCKNRKVGILMLIVLLGVAVVAFGGITWYPLTDFEVKQGGPRTAGVTLIIRNTTSAPLYYITIQFPFAAHERVTAVDCTTVGPGKISKVEKGYTLGIYFVKGEEFASGGSLHCALAIKDATAEELLSYIADPEKLVYRARGMAHD